MNGMETIRQDFDRLSEREKFEIGMSGLFRMVESEAREDIRRANRAYQRSGLLERNVHVREDRPFHSRQETYKVKLDRDDYGSILSGEDHSEMSEKTMRDLSSRMAKQTYNTRITNALEDIVNPLGEMFEQMRYYDNRVLSRQHHEDTLYYQSIINAINNLGETNKTNFFRSMYLNYQQFIRHPVWNTMLFMYDNVLKPMGRLFSRVLFGSGSDSAQERMIQAIEDQTEFLQKGGISQSGFFKRLLDQGILGFAFNEAMSGFKMILTSMGIIKKDTRKGFDEQQVERLDDLISINEKINTSLIEYNDSSQKILHGIYETNSMIMSGVLALSHAIHGMGSLLLNGMETGGSEDREFDYEKVSSLINRGIRESLIEYSDLYQDILSDTYDVSSMIMSGLSDIPQVIHSANGDLLNSDFLSGKLTATVNGQYEASKEKAEQDHIFQDDLSLANKEINTSLTEHSDKSQRILRGIYETNSMIVSGVFALPHAIHSMSSSLSPHSLLNMTEEQYDHAKEKAEQDSDYQEDQVAKQKDTVEELKKHNRREQMRSLLDLVRGGGAGGHRGIGPVDMLRAMMPVAVAVALKFLPIALIFAMMNKEIRDLTFQGFGVLARHLTSEFDRNTLIASVGVAGAYLLRHSPLGKKISLTVAALGLANKGIDHAVEEYNLPAVFSMFPLRLLTEEGRMELLAAEIEREHRRQTDPESDYRHRISTFFSDQYSDLTDRVSDKYSDLMNRFFGDSDRVISQEEMETRRRIDSISRQMDTLDPYNTSELLYLQSKKDDLIAKERRLVRESEKKFIDSINDTNNQETSRQVSHEERRIRGGIAQEEMRVREELGDLTNELASVDPLDLETRARLLRRMDELVEKENQLREKSIKLSSSSIEDQSNEELSQLLRKREEIEQSINTKVSVMEEGILSGRMSYEKSETLVELNERLERLDREIARSRRNTISSSEATIEPRERLVAEEYPSLSFLGKREPRNIAEQYLAENYSKDQSKTILGILNMVGELESGGNYNVVAGGREYDLTSMTIDEVRDLQTQLRREGRESSAAGKYQIMPDTLEWATQATGISGDTLFSPSVQTRLAIELMKRRGLADFLGGGDVLSFMNNMSYEWAAFPSLTGRSAYEGIGSNRHHIELFEAIQAFESARSNPSAFLASGGDLETMFGELLASDEAEEWKKSILDMADTASEAMNRMMGVDTGSFVSGMRSATPFRTTHTEDVLSSLTGGIVDQSIGFLEDFISAVGIEGDPRVSEGERMVRELIQTREEVVRGLEKIAEKETVVPETVNITGVGD